MITEKDEVEKAEAVEEYNLMIAYGEVFDSPAGQRVLQDLLAQTMVFAQTMTGNSWTYFNEGKRSVGSYLLSKLNMANFEAIKALYVEERLKEASEEQADV